MAINPRKRRSIKRRYLGICQCCFKYFGDKLTIHHIKPLSEGGSNDVSNLIPICEPCHKRTHIDLKLQAELDALSIYS